ncbi:TetR/AcrR family transcriptional regulator [Candidatus Aminicenantes bacterium AC-335-K20]|jgi:AcrR family transcriptional regulator|nr:TetR/AcrR family transcriptional regulator [SCandidatus Aminicenantes bacterium Aminicenantia_JdfR_composite]MCP2596716.1 TetR/AcrR family transcriptional regulator [Candidatus Aminicenantes bacterium AC-335-G13]MCP2619432.1 TetR/AcrR family transcriptional regulator [Candidatus Aminicenantes bacterium AC-335-K20]
MGVKERKEREREARKQTILEAAIEIFSRKGYEKTNMEEIAEKAELSKGVIYYYFESKEKLFEELVLSEVSKYYRSAYEAIKEKKDYKEIFSALLDFHISYFSKRKEILSLIFPFGKSSPVFINGELKEKIKEVRSPIEERIMNLLGEKGITISELLWSYIIGISVKMTQKKDIKKIKEEIEIFKQMLEGVLK